MGYGAEKYRRNGVHGEVDSERKPRRNSPMKHKGGKGGNGAADDTKYKIYGTPYADLDPNTLVEKANDSTTNEGTPLQGDDVEQVTHFVRLDAEPLAAVENSGDEVEYEITQPSTSTLSYMRGLKTRVFNNNGPFPERLQETLREIGASDLSFTDSKKNTLAVTLRDRNGIPIELEMTQTEAQAFLLKCAPLFDDANFVAEKKSVAKGKVTKIAPQSGESVEESTAPTLGEAMEELAEQSVPEGFTPVETAPQTMPEKPKVFPAESVDTLDVEPTPLQNHGKNKAVNIPYRMKEENSQTERGKEATNTDVVVNFKLEFGISKEDLASIEGFEKLSRPQQKMVFENLVQSTYGRVKEESASQHAKTVDGRRKEAIMAFGRLAGSTWAGIREVFTKDFNMLKTEQEVANNFKKGGIEAHGDIISQLTRSMATFGPRIHEDEVTGELLPDLVNIAFDRDSRKAEFDAVRNLNSIAHQFAKMPLAWRESTLGVDAVKADEWKVTQLLKAQFSDERKHHLIYDESSKAFTEAKGVLEETLRKGGKNDREIATILLGVDDRVQQLQFIQASPGAITELSNLNDKNIYYESAKSLVSKSGLGYVALGYVARTAVSGLLGWFAAPMVSSGLAASRSWNKTAAELREHDRNARMGVTDTTENALNIVSAENLISKTKMLIDKYHMLAGQVSDRELVGEDSKELQAALYTTLDRLNERVSFIRDKQNLNRINYGTRNSHIGTQVELYELLGEATVIIQNEILPKSNTIGEQLRNSTEQGEESNDAAQRVARQEKLAARLNKFIAYKETAIESRRRSYRRQELTAQALKAGGMALAGAFLAEYFRTAPDVARVDSSEVKITVPPFEEIITESPSPIPQEPLYEIKRGDTLTKILKEYVPEIKEMETANSKNGAIANLLKAFSPDELERIGVKHGNVNLIYAGDSINLEELRKIVAAKEMFVRR